MEFESTWFSILKSIGWFFLIYITGSLLSILFGESTTTFKIDTFVGVFGISLIVATALLIGWVIVGLPVHWVVSKYSTGKYWHYAFAMVIFWGAIWVFLRYPEVLLFFLPISLFQILIFRFYLTKT